MGRNTVILLILILELVCVFGFYLSEVKNQTDVYEVKEDKSTHTLTIINPKAEKPTLREIIYYHVIETPYEQEQVINQYTSDTEHNNEIITGNQHNISDNDRFIENEYIIDNKDKVPDTDNSVIDKEQTVNDSKLIGNDVIAANERKIDGIENNGKEIDFVDSQRKFTNGHGYQFYNTDPESEVISDDSTEKVDDDKMIDTDSKQITDRMEPVDNDGDEMINSDLEELSDDTNPEDDRTTTDKNEEKNVDEETMSRIENFLSFLKSVQKPADLLEPKVDDESIDLKSKDNSYHSKENGDNDVHAVTKRNPENEDMTKQENHPFRNEGPMMDRTLARKKRSFKKGGKTYGMTLTGDKGVVWNDFNDVKFLIPVGTKNNEIEDDKYDDQLAIRSRRDDEDINEDTNKSDNDLEKVSSEEEPNNNQPDVEEPSTENSNKEEPSAEKTNIENFSTKEPSTEKSNMEEPSAEKTNIEKFSTEELNIEKLRKSAKTYGMSLTGDQGMVWNDLNGQRISYHVGNSAEDNENNNSGEDKPSFKASNDDEEINAKIEQFEKDLEEPTSKEKPDNKVPSTAKPISEKPINEEHNAKEPEKPAKTYGMSLNGDHGMVWNDLNGHRVSYHVGEPTINNEEIISNKVPDATDLDEIVDNSPNPFDDGKDSDEDTFSSSELDAMLNKIFGNSKETDKSQNNVLNNEMIEIIKEIVKNETAKIEDKLSCNNSKENDDKNENGKDEDSKIDNDINTPANSLNGNEIPEDIQQITNNEQFWKWLNDWSSAYTELLINRVDMHIKEEVAKQIQEYFATHEYEKATNEPDNNDVDNQNYFIDDKKEIIDSDNNVAENVANDKKPTKKRPDKDSEKKEKGAPVKINASNVYGNSVGNGNVTNIFIFNINNMSDLVNVKPLINGTDGMYIFGNNNEKLDTDKDSVELQEDKDKVEAQTMGNQNESSSNMPYDHDATTDKITLNPDAIEENTHKETTESSKEIVEFTTKLPETEDLQEKGEDKPDKLNGNNGNDQTIVNPNDISNNHSEQNEIKDTTEKATDKTTEILSENVESTSQLPDKEKSEENDKTESKDSKDENYNSDKSKDHGDTASPDSKEVEDKDNNLSESEDNNTKDKNSAEVDSSKDSNEDKEKDDKDKNDVENVENHTNKDKNASKEKVDTDDKTESNDDESKTNKDTASQDSTEDKNNNSSKSEDNNTIDKDSDEVDSSEDSKDEKDDEDQHDVEDTHNPNDNSEDKKDSKEKVETNDKVDQETDSAKDKSTEEKDKHSVEGRKKTSKI